MSEQELVREGMVVSLDYVLTVEGNEVDATPADGSDPIQFILGQGQIIPGLEKALAGMTIGESKKISVEPAEAYGLSDPEAFMTLQKGDFPEEITPQVGTMFEFHDQGGHVHLATVVSLKGEDVNVDLNHPLAGKTLSFDVKVVALRPASEEELAHGHVHGAGGH